MLKCRQKKLLRAETSLCGNIATRYGGNICFLAASPQMVRIRPPNPPNRAGGRARIHLRSRAAEGKEVGRRMSHMRVPRVAAHASFKVQVRRSLPGEVLESRKLFWDGKALSRRRSFENPEKFESPQQGHDLPR